MVHLPSESVDVATIDEVEIAGRLYQTIRAGQVSISDVPKSVKRRDTNEGLAMTGRQCLLAI